MTIGILIAAGLLTWSGATLLIDLWLTRPRRPSLTERLAPFNGSIANEAEAWLRHHR